jgi:LmbE family N-acetylglucosaminyl deacetylase
MLPPPRAALDRAGGKFCYSRPSLVPIFDHPLLVRVREYGALRLMRRLHRFGHRLPVKLRRIERARLLVVAPHMDDEVIGMGGTLVLHARAESSVHVAFCARGATPEEDHRRRGEARAVSQLLGFERIDWLDFPEGALSPHEATLSTALEKLLLERAPEQVFVPYVADHHRDHSAAALALAAALERTRWRGEVWCYEVWSTLWPNIAVDISNVTALKREAIELYRSQVEGLHYADGMLGLNRYRGLRVYVDHAETFFVSDSATFIDLARTMNEL